MSAPQVLHSFFLLRNTCFTGFPLLWGFFLPSRRGRALSLTSGLVSRIQPQGRTPTSVSRTKALNCRWRPLPDQSGSKTVCGVFFPPSFWRYRIMCLFQNYLNLVTLTNSEFESNSDTFVIKSYSGPFCIDSRKQL